MALVSLNSAESRPLIDQIVSGLQRQIDERVLRVGARLPSIRSFATDHRISRFTVVQAYDRLVAMGYITSRKNSGFYVSRRHTQDQSGLQSSPLERAVDSLWPLHQSFMDESQAVHLPGCGWLPPTWQDESSLHRGLRKVSRENSAHLVSYGHAYGYVPLRNTLQHRMSDLGIGTGLKSIITTHGATQALDLLGRYLVHAGDVVLVDDPGYYTLFGYLKSIGARLVGVPRRQDGPDLHVLEQLLQTHQPRVFFTNSVLHNPTATSISQAVAHRLLQLAEQYNLNIVEDDVYGDFHPQPVTRLATLDQLNRVFYVSSFSKTISAGLRVGFVACREDYARDLVDLKLLTSLTTSEVNERIIHHILTEGYYRKHLERVRARLQVARDKTLKALEQCGLALFSEPEYGMFVMASVPNATDTAALATLATKSSILLAPGNVFRPHQEPSSWIRFNVAHCDDPAIFEFLRLHLDGC